MTSLEDLVGALIVKTSFEKVPWHIRALDEFVWFVEGQGGVAVFQCLDKRIRVDLFRHDPKENPAIVTVQSMVLGTEKAVELYGLARANAMGADVLAEKLRKQLAAL